MQKNVGHFPLTKCLYLQYIPRVPGMSQGPHFQTSPQNVKVSTHLWAPQHPYITYTKGAPDALFKVL